MNNQRLIYRKRKKYKWNWFHLCDNILSHLSKLKLLLQQLQLLEVLFNSRKMLWGIPAILKSCNLNWSNHINQVTIVLWIDFSVLLAHLAMPKWAYMIVICRWCCRCRWSLVLSVLLASVSVDSLPTNFQNGCLWYNSLHLEAIDRNISNCSDLLWVFLHLSLGYFIW